MSTLEFRNLTKRYDDVVALQRGGPPQQPDAGAPPDPSKARRSAVKNDLAEDAEQNLRRAPACGPAHVDHRDRSDERDGSHVGDAFAIVVPAGRVGNARGGASGERDRADAVALAAARRVPA